VPGAEEQLTMRELLKDSLFKKWMMKPPNLGVTICYSGKPWRVWVQRELNGRWGKRDFAKYSEAWNFFVKHLKEGAYDAAISSKVKPFPPPVEKYKKQEYTVKGKTYVKRVPVFYIPKVPGMNPQHEWCPHCRRPTIFTTYRRHHAFAQRFNGEIKQRCSVCGIAWDNIRHYK
jgi:hypothetical protein